MGMFDYVDFETTCPACGAPLGGFQTKDRECLMHTVKPWSVDYFYSRCDKCQTRVEYQRKRPYPVAPEPPNWLADFDRTPSEMAADDAGEAPRGPDALAGPQ